MTEEAIKLKPTKEGFSKKELKKAKKALKDAGVPKPWHIVLTNEDDEQIIFEL